MQIERGDTGFRLLASLVLLIAANIVGTVLLCLIVFSLLWTLISRQPPAEGVRSFSNRVVAYLYRAYRYMTYNEVRAPFPFAAFPPEIEPGDWHDDETPEAQRLGWPEREER